MANGPYRLLWSLMKYVFQVSPHVLTRMGLGLEVYPINIEHIKFVPNGKGHLLPSNENGCTISIVALINKDHHSARSKTQLFAGGCHLMSFSWCRQMV